MTRFLVIAALLLSSLALAQSTTPASAPASSAPAAQTAQPAANAPSAQAPQTPSGQTAAQPASGQRKVQAKTKPEYDGFKAADAATADPDVAKAEAAVKDFEGKFPQSDLISILYDKLMKRYQQAGNAEKVLEMGRKEIALDPTSVPALLTVATTLAETTHETDLDWAKNYAEVLGDSNQALSLINSGQFSAPQLSPEQMNAVRSMAYAAIGSIEFTKSGDASGDPAEQAKHNAAAEAALRQATTLNTVTPEAALWLRLAVTLDHEKKYPEAISAANRAAELSANEPNILALAKQEQTRLQELAGAPKPAPSSPTPH